MYKKVKYKLGYYLKETSIYQYIIFRRLEKMYAEGQDYIQVSFVRNPGFQLNGTNFDVVIHRKKVTSFREGKKHYKCEMEHHKILVVKKNYKEAK